MLVKADQIHKINILKLTKKLITMITTFDHNGPAGILVALDLTFDIF